MLPGILKGIAAKKLLVKKGAATQGQVRIHFPNPDVKDIVLVNSGDVVDMFGRIGIQVEDVKQSNLNSLVLRGDVVIVTA